jgi:hypothetical protein
MSIHFFEKVWQLLADDIQYNMRKTLNLPSYQMPINEIKDHLIDKLSVLFNKYGSNIRDYNLPQKTILRGHPTVINILKKSYHMTLLY